MPQFDITIVSRPAIICAGDKVVTTMKNASIACPALWEKFGPRMCSAPANPEFPDESYGASVMLNENDFEYWAVMPLAPGAEVPQGMEKITLPAGEYAHCSLPSLKELGDAYTYIYGDWAKTRKDYGLDMQGVSYELYRSDFMKTGKLAIYCPLVKK